VRDDRVSKVHAAFFRLGRALDRVFSLQKFLADDLPFRAAMFLWKALYDWAKANNLPDELLVVHPLADDRWYDRVREYIDWEWIADQLLPELGGQPVQTSTASLPAPHSLPAPASPNAAPAAKCPGCGAEVGQLHNLYCAEEQCPYTGRPVLMCFCTHRGPETIPQQDRLPWNGERGGTRECQEFGWFVRRTLVGRIPCRPDQPGAVEDLDRLYRDAVWDRARRRFVRKT
jgi:hypothetical protein